MRKISYKSPVGNLIIAEEGGKIVSLDWGNDKYSDKSEVLQEAVMQLEEYFNNKRKGFDLPLNPKGTDFMKTVWGELEKIRHGEVVTYLDIAKEVKSHPRAVGMACGKNPIPIIIPCHRVLAKNGKLNGYSGGNGISTKEKLLKHEGYKNEKNN